MVRKQERVIGTLLVWIGILVTMSVVLSRITGIPIQMRNNWYNSGNVVTGANPEEAARLIESIQSINSELFFDVQRFATAELGAYLPYFVLICAVLLVGGVLSTMFIWRSVIVPADIEAAIESRKEDEADIPTGKTLASLLDDDGEFADIQPAQNKTQEQT